MCTSTHADTASKKLEAAEDAYYKAANEQQKVYRQALGEAILSATRCEVYLLDFDIPHVKKEAPFDDPSDDDHFPIRPYSAETKILKKRELKKDEFQKLLPSLVQTVSVIENTFGALCHMPIHGIRVYDDDVLIFETSICYGCGNFFISYPSGGAGWVSLSTADLKKVMTELMPIPEAELKRFEDAHGGKKTKKEVEK
jgi:hypothetical protein